MLSFDKLPNLTDKLVKGQEAIEYYEISFHNAKTNLQKASSKKNQGFASSKIALWLDVDQTLGESFRLYWIFRAASFYNDAFYWGINTKELTEEWKNGVR